MIFMYKNLFDNTIKKIILSPHYDDFILSLGGLAFKLARKKCQIKDWIIFSNSNYLVDDYNGNKDTSRERIKVVSKIRFKEELHATERIGNIKIKLCDQNEALIRGHEERTKEHDFPYGFNEKMDGAVADNISKLLVPLLQKKVQIFIPLAINKHVDHFIIREVVTNRLHNPKEKTKSQIFFYEDLPYAAFAAKKEWKEVNKFIIDNKLLPIVYPINSNFKLELLDFYNSQTKESYYEGVIKRAKKIQEQENRKKSCEKIYLFPS